jgi:F420-0:gamma-glutamyl ligase
MRTAEDMARESGLLTHIPFRGDTEVSVALKAFEALARADERSGCAAQYLRIMRNAVVDAVEIEREACAKMCEAQEDEGGEWDIQQQCANAIRARGETK